MLYIWPLFAFFSAPLYLPCVLQPLLAAVSSTDPFSRIRRSVKKPTSSAFGTFLTVLGYASLAPLALMIVKYNTIIHPFTLADNRHYMFYIFRYSILRAEWVRYALVPVYIICGIISWKTLGGTSPASQQDLKKPANGTAAAATTRRSKRPESPPDELHDTPSTSAAASRHPPTLSTALLWLLATTLSLMTAPLVEPRYFILPWVFWRLLVPAWRKSPTAHSLRVTSAWAQPVARLAKRVDVLRLWGETAWFVLVNVATMYVFITKPFYWRRPDGMLIEEGMQRFMW